MVFLLMVTSNRCLIVAGRFRLGFAMLKNFQFSEYMIVTAGEIAAEKSI